MVDARPTTSRVHVADIDLYHTDRDRAAYSGGYFWHTEHYQAGRHRHASRLLEAQRHVGRWSVLGAQLHHRPDAALLPDRLGTIARRGDPARQLGASTWTTAASRGSAGSIAATPGWRASHAIADFHGPGRGAGNSINALHRRASAHRRAAVSRQGGSVDRAMRASRTTTPRRSIRSMPRTAGRTRCFSQVLGKYLEYRAERGLVDAKFEYARAVLLKYATWMCAHERPYLDTPEQLEYPTETWAAQDIRKAAVFEFAARHSG